MTDTKATASDKVQVTLKHRHRHHGQWHEPGAKIAASPQQAERIQAKEQRLDAAKAK